MKKKLFISYSHSDKSIVKKFALLLSLRGFDFWMDEKDIAPGENYTTEILSGIHESDIYAIFISKKSLESKWVNAEIDFAMREKIESKKLTIVPVLLEDVDIPIALKNIDYIDARFSLSSAAEEFSNKLNDRVVMNSDTVVSNVSFFISQKTSVQISPFTEGITEYDLKQDRNQVLEELRKKSYGILLNFLPVMNFDFSSDVPKFINGIYEEKFKKIEGDTNGSMRELVQVETMVCNPDVGKLKRLLNERIEALNINAIRIGFVPPLKENETIMDVAKRCLNKIQNQYIILSFDKKDGATVEIDDDFYMSVGFSEDLITLKLSTKYNWQFPRKMKDFSALELMKQLLE